MRFDDRETNADAFEFLLGMHALEGADELVGVATCRNLLR